MTADGSTDLASWVAQSITPRRARGQQTQATGRLRFAFYGRTDDRLSGSVVITAVTTARRSH